MSNNNVVLVECQHGYVNGEAKDCTTCKGSGYVKVVVGVDGKPKKCKHAYTNGNLEKCPTCKGSGWAGLVNE